MWCGRNSIEPTVAAATVDMAPELVGGDAGGSDALELGVYEVAGRCGTQRVCGPMQGWEDIPSGPLSSAVAAENGW